MGEGGRGITIGSEIRSLRDPPLNGSGRQTVWFRGYSTPCEADVKEVNSKIYSAFEGVKSFPFNPIIFQFWRPIDHHGGRLLGSSDNPFTSLAFHRPLQGKYRSRSMSYHYAVQEEEEDNNHPDWIISGGPVVTAFRNRFPEVVLDFRELPGSPLVDVALECDLTSCVALPVFRGGSDCAAGVIECTVKHASLLLPLFVELKRELDRVGLGIYHLQGSWPYTTISGDLEPVKVEIEKALGMACESHGLTLGQVWISCETENDRRMFLVKLSRYFIFSSNDGDPLKDFYDRHDVVHGEGLAGKALQTHQLYLCRNIYKLSDNNKGVLALLSANSNTQCASFVICLRSMHTGDLDYAFEFFWPLGRNHAMLLEPLLLTLKKGLPSFRLASGQHLGDELDVIDVETSSSLSGSKRVKVLQSDLNQSNQYSNPEDDDLVLLATYRNETRLLYLPCSSTYENVMEKLNKEFELDRAQTYKVEYEVFPGQWYRLVCLESCRRIADMGVIKLRLLANRREVGWRWRTNS